MNKKEFKKLIRTKKSQAFFFTTPLQIPVNFAVHPWVVTNNHGKIKRWEVYFKMSDFYKNGNCHFHLNLFKPWEGWNVIPFINKWRFESKLLKKVEGKKANEIISFLEKNVPHYKYRNSYYYVPGPNSNTFVQWILNKFPELKIKLPWTAFGKDYKID